MDGALLVEEALRAAQAEHAFVPDVRMDVEATRAVEAKADEALRVTSSPGSASGTRKGRRSSGKNNWPPSG